ncbi:MAG: nucleotidyl transferase AbiEii/AbiGii toxin family protein [Acidobacteriota bacterium]
MYEEILTKETREVLELLKKLNVLKNFYLAGGTGLSFHLKHRISDDLDFFSQKEINTEEIIQKIKKRGKFKLIREEWGTVIGTLNNVRISFFTYQYPLLKQLKNFKNVNVADIIDIALMKISSISSRGNKRDFIDLYFICKEVISLEELLNLFDKKYREIEYNKSHIIKSLVYFEDAEREPMPDMLVKVNWDEIKIYFENEIKNFSFLKNI